MRKGLLALALVGSLMAGTTDSGFAEGQKPVGGYPAQQERMTIDGLLRFAAEGFTREHFEGVDANGDTYLCVKFIENNPLFEPITFFAFDNNKRPH
jgi:hypothetical protein